MRGKRVAYYTAVFVAALGMFLPLLYGAVPLIRKLLGSNPLLKSVAVISLSWVVAYFTFEEAENGEEPAFFF